MPSGPLHMRTLGDVPEVSLPARQRFLALGQFHSLPGGDVPQVVSAPGGAAADFEIGTLEDQAWRYDTSVSAY